MPARPDIKPRVIRVLAAVAGRSEASIAETQTLDSDLDLGGYVRAALAVPLTRIAREFPEGKRITMAESRNLTTVKAAIDLVHSRANGGD